jgi:glycosyltransferase involved in cell wall biosynthesis
VIATPHTLHSGIGRIAIIAPPWYPVPPDGYGGIEQVVSVLVRELRARGYSVLAFGSAGSGDGILELAPPGLSEDLGALRGTVRELTYLARVFETIERCGPVDVIHDHSGFAGLLGSTLLGVAPVVHTVHGHLGEWQRPFYEAMRGRAGLIAISEHQRSTAPGLSWIATVHNAVDLATLRVSTRQEKQRFLLCLARICPEKGQHTAIEVARRTGYRLVLAGKIEMTAEGQEYFRSQIQPHIDGDKVVYVENVAGQRKADLLAQAAALIAPIEWEEPFGLSFVEAMVSGTAAISFARGAARELIQEGETGFVVRDVDEMVEAVVLARTLDPERCAASARARFNPRVMVEGYCRAYLAAATGGLAAVPLDDPMDGSGVENAIA